MPPPRLTSPSLRAAPSESRGAQWVAISARTLLPKRLWKRDPARPPADEPRNLAVFAAAWIVLIHLLSAAMVGISTLWMGALASGSPRAGAWHRWHVNDLALWREIGRVLLWPYGRTIEVPVNATGSFTNALFVFPLLGVAPMLAMAGLAALRLGITGRSARGLPRAAALTLPWGAAWSVLWFAGFTVSASLMTPEDAHRGSSVVLSTLMGLFAIAMIWWWRRFFIDGLGMRRGAWMIIPMAFVSLIAAWLLIAGLKLVTALI